MNTKLALGLAGLIASSSMNNCVSSKSYKEYDIGDYTVANNKGKPIAPREFLKLYFTNETYEILKNVPIFMKYLDSGEGGESWDLKNQGICLSSCNFFFNFPEQSIIFNNKRDTKFTDVEIFIHEYLHQADSFGLINRTSLINSYLRFKENCNLYGACEVLNKLEDEIYKSYGGLRSNEISAYLGNMLVFGFKTPSYIHNEYKNVLKVSQEYFKKNKKKKHK